MSPTVHTPPSPHQLSVTPHSESLSDASLHLLSAPFRLIKVQPVNYCFFVIFVGGLILFFAFLLLALSRQYFEVHSVRLNLDTDTRTRLVRISSIVVALISAPFLVALFSVTTTVAAHTQRLELRTLFRLLPGAIRRCLKTMGYVFRVSPYVLAPAIGLLLLFFASRIWLHNSMISTYLLIATGVGALTIFFYQIALWVSPIVACCTETEGVHAARLAAGVLKKRKSSASLCLLSSALIGGIGFYLLQELTLELGGSAVTTLQVSVLLLSVWYCVSYITATVLVCLKDFNQGR